MSRLPYKIEICPIIESLIEIRFDTKLHPSVVMGRIIDALGLSDENIESLPINDIPEHIRISEPSLKYKPFYKIEKEDLTFQIGQDVFTISTTPNYVGWERLSTVVFESYKKLIDLKIITKVERLGLRYINFFEEDIFDNIKLVLSFPNLNTEKQNSYIRTLIKKGNFLNTLQIANNAKVGERIGSIIDIDTFIEIDLENFLGDYVQKVNEAHQTEKELFFGLLKEEFLETLKPWYEDRI